LCYKAKPPAVADFDSDPEDEALVLTRCPTEDTLWILDVDVESAGGTCWQVDTLQSGIEGAADLVPLNLDNDGYTEIAIYESTVTKLARSPNGVDWQVDPIIWPSVDPPRQLTVLNIDLSGANVAFVATGSTGAALVYAGRLEGYVLTGTPIAELPFGVGFKEPVTADFEEPSRFNLDDRSSLLLIDLLGDQIPDLVLRGSELLMQEECTAADPGCTRPEVLP
jgi:hypothetical protein